MKWERPGSDSGVLHDFVLTFCGANEEENQQRTRDFLKIPVAGSRV
jgi:hypothetical protein